VYCTKKNLVTPVENEWLLTCGDDERRLSGLAMLQVDVGSGVSQHPNNVPVA
jgi:hypothetical protein